MMEPVTRARGTRLRCCGRRDRARRRRNNSGGNGRGCRAPRYRVRPRPSPLGRKRQRWRGSSQRWRHAAACSIRLRRRSRNPACHWRQNRPRDHVRSRSEEHTSELQSRLHLVCRLLLEKKKKKQKRHPHKQLNKHYTIKTKKINKE